MSRDAIAAVLARDDLACGERLAAFSLASFAGREHRAWPGAATAAQRAGLSRSRYLQARDRLARRGLVLVEAEASGRGRSSTLVMALAQTGPWWEGRSTSICSRRSSAPARRRVSLACCWRRWRCSPTRMALSGTSQPSRSARRPALRRRATSARSRSCWRPERSCSSTGSAAAATRTCGPFRIRACAPAEAFHAPRGGPFCRPALGLWWASRVWWRHPARLTRAARRSV